MKINIVNYEQGMNNGILTKFAVKLDEELRKLGENSYITQTPDGKGDVTHHINYLPYKHKNSPNSLNTLMVTHIWDGNKLDAIKEGLKTAYGICMSHDTKEKLKGWKMPANKLFRILPAHDGRARRHKVVAILTNVYPDGCKRAEMFTELCKTINYNEFAFRIMGSGWKDILVPLVAEGLQVDYFNDFDKELYERILDSSDYALYFGEDEGSMGLLDAVNAGVPTIGTYQGFHKEMGLDYVFKSQKQLNNIFSKLSKANENPVKDWTWANYAEQHLKLWKELLNK